MGSNRDPYGNPMYGALHKAQRKRWARVVEAGGVSCWRCGKPINPVSRWDLGHVDEVGRRQGFPDRHPEHMGCNRATLTHARGVGAAAGVEDPRTGVVRAPGETAEDHWLRVGPPDRWSRHWSGGYTHRCRDCRRLGRACDAAEAMDNSA